MDTPIFRKEKLIASGSKFVYFQPVHELPFQPEQLEKEVSEHLKKDYIVTSVRTQTRVMIRQYTLSKKQ